MHFDLINCKKISEPSLKQQKILNKDFAQIYFFKATNPIYKLGIEFNSTCLIHMLEGNKIVRIDNKVYRYLKGDAALLKSKEKILIDIPIASKQKPICFMAISIEDSFINKNIKRYHIYHKKGFLEENCHVSLKNNVHKIKNIDMNFTIKRILDFSQKKLPQKDFFLKNALKELLILLIDTEYDNFIFSYYHKKENKVENSIENVIKYIKEHLDKPVNFDILYQKSMLSKSKFFKKFKEKLGITPMKFIINEKLNYAHHLTQHTKLQITDIAGICCFENTSHFIQKFKKKFNTTPYKLRQSS